MRYRIYDRLQQMLLRNNRLFHIIHGFDDLRYTLRLNKWMVKSRVLSTKGHTHVLVWSYVNETDVGCLYATIKYNDAVRTTSHALRVGGQREM